MRRMAAWFGLITLCQPAAPADLFEAQEPLALRLEAPLRAMTPVRGDPEFHPGRLLVADGAGSQLSIDLRVRERGKSRRTRYCDFPPLLLDLPGKQPAGSPFDGQNRLKLVTHCGNSRANQQYVRIEMQIYRALNLLTPLSLRVRPVSADYHDSERNRGLGMHEGFLLEDEGRFAKRQGLKEVTEPQLSGARYVTDALVMNDVFQYFIGNTDWSAIVAPEGRDNCCHNIVPFARADGLLVPVPYDFDSSGMVDAGYSMPSDFLPIASNRQRLYRGRCRPMAELQPVLQRFVELRPALTALFTTDAGLSPANAKRARNYIDEFYKVIGDGKAAERAFRRSCGD